jgi:hypothetical protein
VCVCVFVCTSGLHLLHYHYDATPRSNIGVYHNLCPSHTSYNVTCDEQTLALERMLSISGSGLNFVILLVGMCSESFGSRISVMIGIITKLGGLALFSITTGDGWPHGWLIGYTLMTIGGTFIIFPAYPLPFQMFPLRIAGFVFSLYVHLISYRIIS